MPPLSRDALLMQKAEAAKAEYLASWDVWSADQTPENRAKVSAALARWQAAGDALAEQILWWPSRDALLYMAYHGLHRMAQETGRGGWGGEEVRQVVRWNWTRMAKARSEVEDWLRARLEEAER